MTIRARIALLAVLTVGLPQLSLLEGSGAPESGMGTAAASLEVQDTPRPSTETAHTALSDIVADRFSSNQAPAAVAAGLEPSGTGAHSPAVRVSHAAPSALVVLPPSRAPPARS